MPGAAWLGERGQFVQDWGRGSWVQRRRGWRPGLLSQKEEGAGDPWVLSKRGLGQGLLVELGLGAGRGQGVGLRTLFTARGSHCPLCKGGRVVATPWTGWAPPLVYRPRLLLALPQLQSSSPSLGEAPKRPGGVSAGPAEKGLEGRGDTWRSRGPSPRSQARCWGAAGGKSLWSRGQHPHQGGPQSVGSQA